MHSATERARHAERAAAAATAAASAAAAAAESRRRGGGKGGSKGAKAAEAAASAAAAVAAAALALAAGTPTASLLQDPALAADGADALGALARGWDLVVPGALLGALLRGRGEAEAGRLLASVRVFARVSPEQKAAIVRALNASGARTLMMGDGTNDVGALKEARARARARVCLPSTRVRVRDSPTF